MSIKMANTLHICRICLSVNVKMFIFKNTNMGNFYQILTQVNIDDGKPATVCFLCYARLRHCVRLQQQAIKSNELLEQLLKGGFMQATANAIINNQYTSQDLQVSTMCHLDLEPKTCEDVLLAPNVESNRLVSIKEETEAIDEDRKNGHLVLDFFEDGYDPYGFFKDAIHSDSKEDKQITAIDYNHCDGNKDIGHGLEQRKQQDKDFIEDAYEDPKDIPSKVTHFVSEGNEPLKAIGSNKYDGIQDAAHCLERSKQQEKEYQYKVQSGKKIKNDLPSISLNRRDDIIETEDRHFEIHTNSKAFSCNVFQNRYARKCNLIKETGEKPFSCNICEYKCARMSNLKTHIRIHTGEKPFSCNICDYKCALKSNLRNHMRTHTGEKPFSCYICEYKCIQKSNLKRHLETHK